MKSLRLSYAVAAALMLASVPAFSAVLDSTEATTALQATIAESLTVSVDNSLVNFALTPLSATNAGDGTINATATWVLNSGRSSVTLYAYFADPTAALVNGLQVIPSSAVSAKVGGTTVGAFSGSAPGAASSAVTIFTQSITDTNRNSTKSSAVTLNIDLSSIPQLAAGTYTGTLHFMAEAAL